METTTAHGASFKIGPEGHLIGNMEPEELLRQIEARADIVLLDAQPAANCAKAHIKGAPQTLRAWLK